MTRHLIHIGYPKTGSSFLQSWFEKHPEVAFRPGGLAGFHNVYAVASESIDERPAPKWRVTSDETLSLPNREAGGVPTARRPATLGEVHAGQARICQWLSGLFPNAHVLIVTRGFRSMLLSSYSQYVRTGGTMDLEAMFRLTDQSSPWNYDAAIAMYRAAFGGRVIVLPYELLAEDQPRFLRELERRLEIGRLDLDAHPNESLSQVELRWYPRFSRFMWRLRVPRRIWSRYVNAVFLNRLRRPIALLDRIWPAPPVTGEFITDEMIRERTDPARLLAEDPLYAPYAREYMF